MAAKFQCHHLVGPLNHARAKQSFSASSLHRGAGRPQIQALAARSCGAGPDSPLASTSHPSTQTNGRNLPRASAPTSNPMYTSPREASSLRGMQLPGKLQPFMSTRLRKMQGRGRIECYSAPGNGSQRVCNVVFAGGGSGGHIFPAISIAQALLREDPEAQVRLSCLALLPLPPYNIFDACSMVAFMACIR